MKVLFVGARWLGLRVLEDLVARRDVEVMGVYGKGRGWETTDVEAAARRHGLTIRTEHDIAVLLRNGAADLCVSCCTDHIFKADEIAGCRLGVVNLHPAPLPFYRGCNSYAHAIMNGDATYGVSLHYINEGIDTGPIIARDWLPIEPGDTGRVLYDRAQAVAANMWHRELDRIVHWGIMGERVPDVLPQDDTQARYYRRSSLDDKRTHPDDDRRIRALTFGPHPPPLITTDVPVGFGR